MLYFSPPNRCSAAHSKLEAHCFGDKASPGQITLFRPNLSSSQSVLPSCSRKMVHLRLVFKTNIYIIIGVVFVFIIKLNFYYYTIKAV